MTGDRVAAWGTTGTAWSAEHSGVSTLDPREYALFAQVARPRAVAVGQRLFRRGGPGNAMYVVASGAVELDWGEGLSGRRLGERAYFGELGLLVGEHTRGADACVLQEGILLELRHDDFHILAARDPHLLAQFLRRAILRAMLSEHVLVASLRRRNQELQETLDALRSTSRRLDQTEALTRTDELTGLANRRGLLLYLQNLREQGMRIGHALLLLDCDRFKAINDTYGHLAGDRVLQGVANLLRAVAGKDDIACRLGGDEFCLLLQGQGREDVRRIAGYVADSARMLARMHRHPPQMTTVSIGACLVEPHETPDWEHCYARVDRALYRAKRRGGGHVEWMD